MAHRFSLRSALKLPSALPRWNLLSWRKKSLLIAAAAIAVGTLLTGTMVSLWLVENAPLKTWFSITFAPFVFVIMLGMLARMQQRIDLRAGRHSTLPPHQVRSGGQT